MGNSFSKVLMYIESFRRGGAERVFAYLANHFCSDSTSVVLVNDFVTDSSIEEYPLDSRIYREYIQVSNRGGRIVKNFYRMHKLRMIIRREKPDLVISFLRGPVTRMLLATVLMDVIKVVSVRNDPYHEFGPSRINKFVYGNLLRMADGCVFQLPEAANYFPKAVQKQMAVIKNPVKSSFFSVKRSCSVSDIVTFGRLEEQKNHFLLIDAFSKIAKDFPEENLVIYGEGELRESLVDHIKKIGLIDRVFLPGNISDTASKLSTCKVFVLSSNFEGMPNALLEAMAAGVPIVSTDCPCGGPRELLRSGGGLLVPVGDCDSLADALTWVLSNYQKAVDMGMMAHQQALLFKEDIVLKQWDDYFGQLCSLK